MQRKNITITDEQNNWINEQSGFNLSQEVQDMLDEKIENESWSITTVSHNNGIKLGRNAISEEYNQFNPFDFPQGFNGLTMGDISAGKTVTNILGLSQLVDQPDLDEEPLVIMIDGLSGLADFTSEYGGQRYDVSHKHFNLNPLEFAPPAYDVDGYLANWLKEVRGLLQTIFAENQQISDHASPEKWDVFYSTMHVLFEEKFEHESGDELPTSLNEVFDGDYINNQLTIRDHLIPELWKVSTGDSRANDQAESAKIPTQSWGQRILDSLEVLRNGDNFTSHLTGETTVKAPTDENLVCLDYSNIAQPGLQTPYMLYLQAYRWAQIIDRPTVIYVDQGRELLRNEHAHELLESSLRHARQYDLSIQINGGSIDTIGESEFSKTLIDLCAYVIIHRSENIADDSLDWLRSQLDLDEIHTEYIQNCRPGTEDLGYSEAAMRFPSSGWQPVQIAAQTEKQQDLISNQM